MLIQAVQFPRVSSQKLLVVWLVGVALLSGAGCRREAGPNGVVQAFGTTGLGWGDFSYPRAISMAAGDKFYVVDKSARIQRFDQDGKFEVGWWMPDYKSGKPVGLTVHPDGRVLVADTHYHRISIFTADGQLLETRGGEGDQPGQFRLPTDVEVAADGTIFVSEYGGNDRITHFTADWQVISTIGEVPVAGMRINRPNKIDLDAEGNIWVADSCNHRIVCFAPDGTFLTSFGELGDGAGQLRFPYDLHVCRDGTLLVAEYGNHRLQWFNREGKSLRTWGTPGRELGQLYSPWGAAEGANGLVYIVDSLNNRLQMVRP
ncbi:MAG: Virginiamycin B lyase [Phycisphaerae bacterium]|nr:Virginiamycin B lyase [Phycisphaerae bacterium]